MTGKPDQTPSKEAIREALRASFVALNGGKFDEKAYRAALADASEAIFNLPCEGCGGIDWPVVKKPEHGSVEWWDDPSAYFACRSCGCYLASGSAYPYIRQANPDFPLSGVLPSAAERREQLDRDLGLIPPDFDDDEEPEPEDE